MHAPTFLTRLWYFRGCPVSMRFQCFMALSAHDVCFKLQYPLPPKRLDSAAPQHNQKWLSPKQYHIFLGKMWHFYTIWCIWGTNGYHLGTIILDKPLTKEFYLGSLVTNHSYQRFRYSFCGWLHHQPEIAVMEAESWTRGQRLSLAQSRKSNPWQWRSLAPLATFTQLSCSV